MLTLKKSFILVFAFLFGLNTYSFSQMPQGEHPSDEEFSTFIDAFKKVQVIDQQAQEEIISTIDGEGLEVERFNEIQQAAQHPDHNIGLTEKEQEKFNAAVVKIQEIQTNAQQQMQQDIEKQGISVQRYQEIVGLIQQTPELMEKFRNEMQ